jgi:short-subunit dehydrogenase
MKKVAIVTGASSGIGRDIAIQLARESYHLVVTARRKERLEDLKKQIESQTQSSCYVLACDLTNRSSLQNLIDESLKWSESIGGELSVLVNNAGSGVWDRFIEIPVETSQRDIDVNVVALTTLSYHFIREVKKKGNEASILNIASMAAFMPVANYAVYSATKAYVKHFSEVLDYELKETNISVTCVCPGGVKTEFVELAGQRLKDEKGIMSSPEVAKYSVVAMKKKKLIAVPGLLNRLSLSIRHLPNTILIPLVEKMMSLAVEKK